MAEITRSRKTTGKVTLADVAKVVGVGQMTVSRALRQPALVSEEMREKIEQAVQQLGYVPNFAARQLASATSRNLVVVTHSLISRENALILSALQENIRELDVQLVILIADNKHWLRELINHSPLAIVLLNLTCPANAKEWITQSGMPCLEIGSIQQDPLHINVGIDSKQAMKKMVTFLVEKGYQEIALLSATQELAIFQQYLASWHTTLLAKHINPHLMLHSAEPISFSAGGKLFSESLLLWGKIDALVFVSDELACGALYEAQRRHISVPQDIAIASLGGLDVGTVSYPRLTTISIPYEQIGYQAGKMLKRLLQDDMPSSQTKVIEIPTKLAVRESC
ncbi:LacI family DNA-binding transcriptional regulator [Lonepinella sp. BR2357]|uniref:LacI family DNA-binding transcriptional regulator n=1 Tax=Lonepinella sp. BR2357 TaxID=3434549 RepID=UPI003F6DC933